MKQVQLSNFARRTWGICFTSGIFDLFEIVGKNTRYQPHGGFMVIYHGRKQNNHLKQTQGVSISQKKRFFLS